MDISIVIPVFNEENNLERVYERLLQVFSESPLHCELVFVDDGSTDGSLGVLKRIKETCGDAFQIKVVELSRNFGQHPAIIAGFSEAEGRLIATMDADLQIDPTYLLPMIEKIGEQHDMVSGIRIGRSDSFLLRRLPSRVLNLLIGRTVSKRLKDFGCPLNVFKKEIVQSMADYGEMRRFYKALAAMLARSVAEVEVRCEPRQNGRSKYNLISLIDLFFEFVTNFSRHLFQRVVLVGLILGSVSFLVGVLYMALRFPFKIIPEPMDRLQAVIAVGFTFGMELLILGVLGDFVVKIYRKVDSRPLFTVKKVW
ncbi:MAG: hypothetical protein COZ70_11025 [Deltaproteobacteria bacterium CG_4_8_14_3_um_filter_51_11]|nr:MAG: hypothetical protein COX16_06225 [Deltaproteobacteria bacterium CG23_combo_of_CG06-09_8_20_14_all_51_20]PIX19044.1 MAG: hypothetical protein COZ70_11025 [Deltaproteobacteria bacterium CG_4_8_14_3_um_filter_51_11]PJB37611.1 MAG: hypothetical protein CO107_04310 [Deltaproteobacteria bacterium CG_4_9_14_3_um_filter_51_14]